MDALHLCVAITPLAIYFVYLAAVNLRARPTIINGSQDTMLLAGGISGLVIAGPLELFLPESTAFRFGPYTWVLLLGLYALGVVLTTLSLRPRLIIYNITLEELRPLLASVVHDLDEQSKWAGDGLDMPQLDVHLHVERLPSMRNVQLVSSGSKQNFQGWNRLEKALQKQVGGLTIRRNQHGFSLLLIGSLLAGIAIAALVSDHASMAQSIEEMLRM